MDTSEVAGEKVVTPERVERDVRYLIPESVYDYDHPEVIYWTKYFQEEAAKHNVFVNINATINSKRSITAAESMATAWYDFTRYVPVFLCKAVALTDDPERQHHLIQIAYDELGGRDKDFIHSNLFLEAISDVGIDLISQSAASIKEVLSGLDRTLEGIKSQYGIVGLLLSFEIIAEENIETLYNCLCHDKNCEKPLSESPFFKIHRADETEHIRHSVANFLRFCKTDTQKSEFKESFDAGIDFWQRFWDQNARIINMETDLRATA
ncbi:iron-containing redox enzyme family protein [Microbulbifer halophilus]|uniref:Iron-containing redox enzyme family protein n=1 Tax=Microbulbifer halophilus TaxID=453963 RepID=A0ABW5EC03_9GAMM|nr:iron-containing redox enzyme family protein [Microbulbifer halophilus]MCW8126211.1 iron-containing redox enzyme family protein [Microbulbifer halophilus]